MPTPERFPRNQKFLLGDRIQHTALDVLERLIEATYTRRRGSHPTLANVGLEKLRFLCRLAHDLRYLDARRYEHAARSLNETGRRVGAWTKAHRAQEAPQSVLTASRASLRCCRPLAVLPRASGRNPAPLERRRPRLHPRKTAILPTCGPAQFLGFVSLHGDGASIAGRQRAPLPRPLAAAAPSMVPSQFHQSSPFLFVYRISLRFCAVA